MEESETETSADPLMAIRTRHLAAKHAANPPLPAQAEGVTKRSHGTGEKLKPAVLTSISEPEPVDTPLQVPTTPITSTKPSESSCTSSDADLAREAEERSRPADRSFRPPTPLRSFPHPPKLWYDYEPPTTTAEAFASWVASFVPVIYAYYSSWPAAERTAAFDKLIESEPERYRNAIVRLYADHPELLLDRPRSERAQRFIAQRWHETPARTAKLKLVFNDWDWARVARQPPRDEPLLSVGPLGETVPGDVHDIVCQHCIREAKKARLGKILRPVIAPIVAPVQAMSRKLSTKRSAARPEKKTERSGCGAVERAEEEVEEVVEEEAAEGKAKAEDKTVGDDCGRSSASITQRESLGHIGLGRRRAIRPRVSTIGPPKPGAADA